MDPSDLLRSSGEEHHFDWKQDRDQDAQRKRNPRGKLIKPEEKPTRYRPSKRDNQAFNKSDRAVLSAIERNETTVFHTPLEARQKFMAINPDLKLISASKATRFIMLARPNESFNDFENRVPAKVIIFPVGTHFEARFQPKDSDEERHFSTKGIVTILLNTKGQVTSFETRKRPKPDEISVPPHVYAAWRVDGHHRQIPLADYLKLKTARIKKSIDETTGTFTIQLFDGKNVLQEKRFNQHAGFYLMEGQIHQLQIQPISQGEINQSLMKSLKAAFIAFKNPHGDLTMKNISLTSKGLDYLNRFRVPEPSKNVLKPTRPKLTNEAWSVLRGIDEGRPLDHIPESTERMIHSLRQYPQAQRSSTGEPYLFRPHSATRYLFLSRPEESFADFKTRTPENRFWYQQEGNLLRAGLKGKPIEESATLDTSYNYYWNEEKGTISRSLEQQSKDQLQLSPKAFISWTLATYGKTTNPDSDRALLKEYQAFFTYQMSQKMIGPSTIRFTNNINDQERKEESHGLYYLHKDGKIHSWKKAYLDVETVEEALEQLLENHLIKKDDQQEGKYYLEEHGLRLLGKGPLKSRADYEQEADILRQTGNALGFIPKQIIHPQHTERFIQDHKKSYRQKTMTTHSGVKAELLIQNGSNPIKRRELGHEIILADGVKQAFRYLKSEGASDIRFVSENELRSLQTKAIQGTAAPFMMPGQNPPDDFDEEAQIKGLPDGVFIYTDKQGIQKGLAIEADSGDSPLSNSRGYDEPDLQMKDNWSKARGIGLVYIVHTQDRAAQIRKNNRQIWVIGR